jgi:general stress protein YciG
MTTNKQTNKQGKQQANKGKQGFASMDPEKQREIASKGGHAAHSDDEAESKAEDSETDGAEEYDESEELDELLEILGDADLTELDPEEGLSIIEEWQEILKESGDAGLKEIGKSLKQLEKALSNSKSKPATIADALTHLGEQTDHYANEAERGYKTKLHKLGKALSKAGKSLEHETEE